MRGSAELPTIGWLSDPEHWLSIAEPVALFHRIGWLRHPGIFNPRFHHFQLPLGTEKTVPLRHATGVQTLFSQMFLRQTKKKAYRPSSEEPYTFLCIHHRHLLFVLNVLSSDASASLLNFLYEYMIILPLYNKKRKNLRLEYCYISFRTSSIKFPTDRCETPTMVLSQ